MIRNIRGMILAGREMSDRVQTGRCANSLDCRGGLRSRKRFARQAATAMHQTGRQPPGTRPLRANQISRIGWCPPAIEPQSIAHPSRTAGCRPERSTLLEHLRLLEISGQVVDGVG